MECVSNKHVFVFMFCLVFLTPLVCSQLYYNFYIRTCPNLNRIVKNNILSAIANDSRIAASLLRLHFHDCFVNGCDGSVLLDDTDTLKGEKNALPNKNSLRGFDVIDKIKSDLENACPSRVSCADILTLAARDAVYLSRGPFWAVPLGRRDGTTASESEANNLPSPFEPLENITAKFISKGLEKKDVAVLSGSHTFGFAQCFTFKPRLFDFGGSGKSDPSLDSSLLQNLQRVCPNQADSDTNLAPLDPATSNTFDNVMTDVPFGVLLSGGLDSSLVAAVANRYLAGTDAARQWGSQLHTFCIGIQGSPDLKAAKEVANYLGTCHHELHFTVQEGIDALEEVIYHIETYDVTTVRASTPMFLMSRKIKSLGVKMVLSGEGSDEIFGGYLYFHKAPNKEELHQETCRKIKALHLYDCLRANKSTSAWGIEARVPFLDKEFINTAMDIDPEWKMIKPDIERIEKWVLRNAFDDDENPYLPKHILYRQKEQFSDGVGYSWIDGLKDHANEQVTDAMLKHANFVYPENTPTTKEGYHYRTIFEKLFPKGAARSTVPGGPSVACSTAKAVEWDAAWSKNLDPSGRAALGVHAAAYKDAVDIKIEEPNNGSL